MKKWLIRVASGLAGVIALSVAVLALMGLRGSAGLSTSLIEINAAPEQVWGWIEDPDKFKQWVGWVVSVESPTPELKGVGRRTIVLMNEPGSPEPVRLESICTEYAPPLRFSADVTFPGLFTGSQTYQLTDLGAGRTRVQLDTRIRYTSWFIRLFEPLATPASTQKTDRDLASLKTLVEKSLAAAAK